eukprot:SAG22_NODE_844_length_6872_cov_10.004577_5_plen_64_part_00
MQYSYRTYCTTAFVVFYRYFLAYRTKFKKSGTAVLLYSCTAVQLCYHYMKRRDMEWRGITPAA